ncbi:hypothetical protein Tco_0209126 [Tanacetum coccineum]
MGTWTPTSTKLFIISVYAPQELSEKRQLWDYLSIMMTRWEGEVLSLDYGPTSFQNFHSWFKLKDFDKVVEESWKSSHFEESNGDLVSFKEFGDSYRAPAQDKSVSGEATPSFKGRTQGERTVARLYGIKWNMALLCKRADRFWREDCYKYERTRLKSLALGNDAIDGTGSDWSFMAEENEASENQALVAEEVVPTEFALMAMFSSSSDNEVEARLVEFKINESKFCEKIRVLERDLELKDYKIKNLTNELEEVKKERDGIDSKLEKFVNSSKDLDQMLESQKSGKDKKGVGFDEYRAVPPPPAQVYSSPMPDLSWTGLPEFADNTVTDYTRPTPSVDVTNDVRSELDGNNLTVCEHGGTSSNAVSKPIINFVKESGCPNVIKINNIENPRKPTAKYAELYRNITQSSNVRSNNFGPPIIEDWDSEDKSDTESTPIESIRSTINQNRDQPRGNQRNWNNLKSQQLGKDFVMQNKACYKCGSFEHLKVNCNKNKTSLDAAQPKMKSFVKSAHSNVKMPFERKAATKNKIWVPTVRTKNSTVGLKVPTTKPTVAAAKGNKGKAVKASARWIWKPKQIFGEGSEINYGKDEKQSQNRTKNPDSENGKRCKRQRNRSRKVNQVKKSTEKSTGQSQSQPKSTPRPKVKEI